MTTPGAAPPQLSPDGHWWWDGTQWQPASEQARAHVASQAAVPAQQVPAQAQEPQPVPAQEPQPVPAQEPAPASYSAPFGSVLPAQAAPSGRSLPGGPRALAVVAVVAVLGVLAAAYLLLLRGGDEPVTAAPPVAAAPPLDPVKALRTALFDAGGAEEAFWVDASTYTRSLAALQDAGYIPVGGVQVTIVSASKTTYCLKGVSAGKVLYFTPQGYATKPCR